MEQHRDPPSVAEETSNRSTVLADCNASCLESLESQWRLALINSGRHHTHTEIPNILGVLVAIEVLGVVGVHVPRRFQTIFTMSSAVVSDVQIH